MSHWHKVRRAKPILSPYHYLLANSMQLIQEFVITSFSSDEIRNKKIVLDLVLSNELQSVLNQKLPYLLTRFYDKSQLYKGIFYLLTS
jgi:hypothetical protein